MRIVSRVLCTAVAASLTALVVTTASAGAATSGVGTTTTNTTVLSFQLGSGGATLNLSLLTDHGTANTDAKAGAPGAEASLVPASISSGPLHLSYASPAVTTKAPGGATDAGSPGLTLASLGVPAPVATATLQPAALHADFAPSAAHASMTAAEIKNLSVAGGAVLSVDSFSSNLKAVASGGDADGTRGVNIGTIKVLDLGALLKGLGISPGALTVQALSKLISQLGVPVSGLPTGTDLSTYVGKLQATITALEATVSGNQVTGTLTSSAQGVLNTLGVPIPVSGNPASSVTSAVNQVQNAITGVLTKGLEGIDSAPLVTVKAGFVGINTKATDSLPTSVAAVTASPIQATVAGVSLPAIDPTAAVSTINSLLATATSALDAMTRALGLPDNLVSVSVLDKATSKSANGGYITAAAGVTALTAKVAPISASIVTNAISHLPGTPISSLLGAAMSAVSMPVATAMGALDTVLGQAAPLTGGATVRVASLSGVSSFATPASVAPVASPSLPRTGGNPALALGGALMAVLAAAAFAWRRLGLARHDPAPAVVEVKR